MRTRAERRWNREVKAWRRIKEDRQQHMYSRSCPCFGSEDRRVWGRTFARFADTPKPCSCRICGNPRRFGDVTLDERRAGHDHQQQLRTLEHDATPSDTTTDALPNMREAMTAACDFARGGNGVAP